MGTKAVEAESGYSVNEPVNYAVRAAIEAGIIEIINQGEKEGLWKFKTQEVTGTSAEVIENTDPGVSIYCEAEDNCYTSEDLDEKATTIGQ